MTDAQTIANLFLKMRTEKPSLTTRELWWWIRNNIGKSTTKMTVRVAAAKKVLEEMALAAEAKKPPRPEPRFRLRPPQSPKKQKPRSLWRKNSRTIPRSDRFPLFPPPTP